MHESTKQAKIFLKHFYYIVNVIINIFGDLAQRKANPVI